MWKLHGRPEASDSEIAAVLTRIDEHTSYFDPERPLVLGRAPARLDLMGGIADYSGSLVLQMPLSAAAWVAAQWSDEPSVVIMSTAASELAWKRIISVRLDQLFPPSGPLDYQRAHELLTSSAESAWGAYVAGVLVALDHRYAKSSGVDRGWNRGLKILVDSRVPIGKGVSSSAALEVATLQAVSALLDLSLEGRELALLAQKAENLVVGAPCGVMDQMTSACGERDHLLALLCQPAEIEPPVPLPHDVETWGLDSGIRHAVSGADYGTVRAAAFMGYRIIAAEMGLAARPLGGGRVAIHDPPFRGYLANLTPREWEDRFRDHVPEALEGRDFLDRYQGHTDLVTEVDPARTYALRVCTAHPIYEHQRVRRFRDLLTNTTDSERSRCALGELMRESHESYGACGLGSDGTDRLVELVREVGAARGLYGAKITGGGSGGTVAVLARSGSQTVLEDILARYEIESGRKGSLLGGSSPGATSFGVLRLTPD